MEKLQEKKKDTDLNQISKQLKAIAALLTSQLLLLKGFCNRLDKLN